MWYQGELDFFDQIVIPLATKLSASGVFAEEGEELLENAVANRAEWEAHGHDVLEVYMAHYQESHVQELNNSLPNDDDNNDVDTNHQDEPAHSGSSSGSLGRFLEKNSKPGLGDSVGVASEDEARSIDKLDSVSDEAPALEPGTANSSVGGLSEPETTNDPDVVFAVLENPDAPDDFDSYILLTPAQVRQRDREEREKDNKSVGTAATGMRAGRRRFRRTNSSASNAKELASGARRRGSMASKSSRASLFSADSNHTGRSESNNTSIHLQRSQTETAGDSNPAQRGIRRMRTNGV